MSQIHPLDEIFRQQLQDLNAETPFHLWEGIDTKRSWKHRFLNKVQKNKPFVLLLASVAIAGSSYLVWNAQQPSLAAFPVPAPAAIQAPAPQAIAATTATPALLSEQVTVIAESATQAGQKQVSGAKPLVAESPEALRVLGSKAQLPVAKAGASLSASATVADNSASAQEQWIDASTAQALVKPEREAALPMLMKTTARKDGGSIRSLFAQEPKCAEFGNGFWNFYLDVLASPDLTFSNMQARDANFEEYTKSRRETESLIFAFSGGLRLSIVGDNGLAFRTGVNYSQVNEKFNYFNGTEERTIIRDIRDNQGNIIGTETVVEIGERYLVTRNTYQMLDIPFVFGYERKFGALGISANAGAYLNLLFRQQGNFLSPQDLKPVSIDSGDPEAFQAFKRQAGLGYYGSLGFAYETRSGMQLLLEPHFKLFPKSITQDAYVVQQRHSSVGLFVGIRTPL